MLILDYSTIKFYWRNSMKKLIILILFPISFALALNSSEEVSKESTAPETISAPGSTSSKIYYGGNIGLSFWNSYFYLSVQPLIGYKVTPKFSIGGKLAYSYISDRRIDPTFNSHNYGGSIFTRYRVVPQFYLHGEFVYASIDRISGFDFQNNEWRSERVWIPFLLLGGGYAQMVSPNVWVFAEVLFDVLQDSNSPYEKWDPFVSFGVGVGF